MEVVFSDSSSGLEITRERSCDDKRNIYYLCGFETCAIPLEGLKDIRNFLEEVIQAESPQK